MKNCLNFAWLKENVSVSRFLGKEKTERTLIVTEIDFSAKRAYCCLCTDTVIYGTDTVSYGTDTVS